MESLRVWPPVAMTARTPLKGDYIDGVYIPKGILVMFPVRQYVFLRCNLLLIIDFSFVRSTHTRVLGARTLRSKQFYLAHYSHVLTAIIDSNRSDGPTYPKP